MMPTFRCLVICLLTLLSASLPSASTMAVDAQAPVKLVVYPERIVLISSRESQDIVVQLQSADGSTRDVSAIAQLELGSAAIARLKDGILTAVADGKTELQVKFEGLTCTIPVEVTQPKTPAPLRFRDDVLPILTRSGCNTGKCHGSASGKDGFRLSLFGYDPAGDYFRLTREMSGRRINLAAPANCLLVNKATGQVSHTGGQRIDPESDHYQTLLNWLQAGAQPDPTEIPVPVRIEVFPQHVIFAQKDLEQKLLVMAYYSDGADRDVTDLAVFFSNNEATAKVSEDGVVTSTGSGAAFIMARFDQFTQGTSVIVRPGTPFVLPEIPTNNYIDELAQARWREMHILPSELCSDEVFLRRVYNDLIGLLPTSEERQRFLTDTTPNRRERLVDALLERDEFLDIWVMKWAEILQIRTINGVSPKGLQIYDRWLRERVRSGATIDKIVQELIPATGGTFDNPPSNYYQTETTPQLLAENVAQAFLGTRIQCAQCHNHPFDRWTMDDYYGFSAFFSQVGYKQAQDPRELTVFNAVNGDMRHPVSGLIVSPRYLGDTATAAKKGEDYRQSLATWLSSKKNVAFARNAGNIVWAQFFGIGIVEPVDDIRVSNPPANPQLFAALGDRLIEYEFDIKKLARDICNSRTYQLSTQRNEANAWDERQFSHSRIRRMRAEVLLDCVNLVTEAQERFPGLPAGGRAVQLADGRTQNYFLTTFGRSTRNTPCTCEVKTSPTLSQALHLLNGETTSGKIVEGKVIERLLKTKQDPMLVATELYERCLSREPSAKEAAAIKAKFAQSQDVNAELVDLFWALLNSNEFVFNH
jgi:hypothetical protein